PVACQGAAIAALPTTSTNGVTGSWSPAINNSATTQYTFTPTAGQCTNTTLTTLTITVNPNVTYYRDADGDTFGDALVSTTSCTGQPAGYVTNNTDCDDTDNNSHERFSFYVDADHDGHGVGSMVPGICAPNGNTPPVGYSLSNDDCDDLHATVYPGATEIPYDGLDNNCNNVIDETGRLTTKLLASACGSTLTSIGSLIGITTLPSSNHITGYRIRVTNGSQVQTIDRSVPNFSLTMLASYDYATTYTVEVMLQRESVYLNYYGDACFVSSPAVLDQDGATSVSPSQCGQRIPTINTLISTTSLAGATGYRFRITDITPNGTALVQTIDRPLQWFSLPMLAHYNYNATYTVEVAVKTTGDYSGYGSPCEVSSPLVTMTNCGMTASLGSTPIAAISAPGVTQYKFIVTKMPEGSATTIDRSTNYFTFNMIPGYVPGGRYSVRVSTYTKNDWSVSSDACTVFAPGGTPNKAEVESPVSTTAFTAVASPNPFALDFAIRVNTAGEDQVQFRVYDMLGKVVESRSVAVSELEGQHIGSNYPSGVYNVVVTQGENVKTLRV
ncbi:MopE-related protein, partial [Flavobacterium noncentrifugens]|uniref:MopE-related protein n=1 Tax=Flavobacterium noncentrifugens TaxID=1128970 RepID=UPI0011BE345A